MIYLDNAATTKVMPQAVNAAAIAMEQSFGNPSSLHRMGVEAERLVSYSKNKILSALGDTSGDVIFTSGATEANNMAIFGLYETYGRRKKRIVTTSVEHPSVAEPMSKLQRLGCEVVRISPDSSGKISRDAIADAVNDDTFLVSAMLVNNETGSVLPVAEAFSLIKKRFPECKTHCDCVQGFEKLPVSAKKLCADAISLSGHKIHAPKGIGALYLKKSVKLSPLMLGGGQQGGLRSGTEAVPLIYGLGKAVEILTESLSERYAEAAEINRLARRRLSDIGAVVISESDASPYILSIAVPNIKSETMLHFLEESEIYVSSGSACSKGKKSGVLKEFGVHDKYLDSVIRLSFSHDTSAEDIEFLCKRIKAGMDSLVKIKGK